MLRLKSSARIVLAFLASALLTGCSSWTATPSVENLRLDRFQPGPVSDSDQATLGSAYGRMTAETCVSTEEAKALRAFLDTAATDRRKLRALIGELQSGSSP